MKSYSKDVEHAWSWLYSWHLINDSRANLVALCRFLLVYLPGGPRAEAWAKLEVEAKVWVGARASIETKV